MVVFIPFPNNENDSHYMYHEKIFTNDFKIYVNSQGQLNGYLKVFKSSRYKMLYNKPYYVLNINIY